MKGMHLTWTINGDRGLVAPFQQAHRYSWSWETKATSQNLGVWVAQTCPMVLDVMVFLKPSAQIKVTWELFRETLADSLSPDDWTSSSDSEYYSLEIWVSQYLTYLKYFLNGQGWKGQRPTWSCRLGITCRFIRIPPVPSNLGLLAHWEPKDSNPGSKYNLISRVQERKMELSNQSWDRLALNRTTEHHRQMVNIRLLLFTLQPQMSAISTCKEFT